jgi:hypothetical protein
LTGSSGTKLWGAFVACAILGGTLVHWPVLHSGYLIDDYLQLAMLEGTYPVPRSPLELYSFVRSAPELSRLVEHGTLPWWSHPEYRLSPLRPLASLSLAFDHWLGLSAFAKHLHSQAWWIGLVVAFSLLARRLLPLSAAACAVALFALDPARLGPISWLANRSALISVCFGILALGAHVRWREEATARGAFASGAYWTLALLGGEYAVSMVCFAVGYELLARSDSWRARARALLPAALPLLGYGAIYAGLGFGMAANWLYVTPFSAPLLFLKNAAARLPALLADDLLLFPAEVTEATSNASYAHAGKLAVALVAFGWLVAGAVQHAEPRCRRILLFLAAAWPLSMLPLLATLASTRLLLAPSVASCLLIGAILLDAAQRLRLAAGAGGRLALVPRALAAAALLVHHLVHAPLGTISLVRTAALYRQAYRDFCLNAPIDDAAVAAQDLVLINAHDVLQATYIPHLRHAEGRPLPRRFYTLALSRQQVIVKRTGPNELELGVVQGSLLEHPHVLASRPGDAPFKPHGVVDAGPLRIEIIAVGPAGPTRVRFRFAEALESPELRFLIITERGLTAFPPPGLGERVAIKLPGFGS